MTRSPALLIGKCVLLGAIAAAPFAFSAWVDPARLRGNPAAERAIVQALLDGHYVTNVANYGDRAIERLLAGSRELKPDILVIGSSRAQSVPPEAFPGATFVNASVTDARLDDLIGVYGLYASDDRRAKTVIINLDPWTLTAISEQEFWLPLFASHDLMLRQMGDSSVRLLARARLIVNVVKRIASPEYFRLAVFSLRTYGPHGIRYEITERAQNPEKTKAPDGNIIWKPISPDEATHLAAEYTQQVRGHAALYNGDVDTTRITQLEQFLRTIRNSGVNVEVMLVPFNPLVYSAFQGANPGGVATMEAAYRKIAQRVGARVVGGYDPVPLNVTAGDLFDESHMRPAALIRLLRR